MRNSQAKLERMKNLARLPEAPRFLALLATLFMVVGAVHESGHDHSDHDPEADCVICTIASAQTVNLPSANSFAAPLLTSYDHAPTNVAAPFVPSTHYYSKPRGPPTTSPLQ